MSPTDPFPPGTLVFDPVTGDYFGTTVSGKDAAGPLRADEVLVFNPHNPQSRIYVTYPLGRLSLVSDTVVDLMRQISAGALHVGDLVHDGGELRVVRWIHRMPRALTTFLVLSGAPRPGDPVPADFPPDALWGYRDNYPIDLPVTAYCVDRC